jgi:hypothetical protein
MVKVMRLSGVLADTPKGKVGDLNKHIDGVCGGIEGIFQKSGVWCGGEGRGEFSRDDESFRLGKSREW